MQNSSPIISEQINNLSIKPSIFYDQTSSDSRKVSLNPPSYKSPVDGYHHTRLMLPSERQAEFKNYRESLTQQRFFKEANAFHSKQRLALERGLSSDGVIGISSPVNRPDPVFTRRAAELASLPQERARTSPENVEISSRPRRLGAERFLDTHARLWPAVQPSWSVGRALEIHSYDIRDRNFNIVTGACNSIKGLRVRDKN